MHASCSQEVQSQVLSALLNPVRDLTQNWEVDLAKHLEKYLHQLCEIPISENGINFAEAALLIQTSVGIYGKKVEYLWQILLRVLESFRRQKKGDGKKESKEEAPKKRQQRSHISDSLEDFVEFVPIIDDKKKKEPKQKPIKFQPYIYSQLENKAPSNKKINIFGPLMDPLGDKADFRLNNQISNRFMLEEEMSVLMSIVSEDLQPITAMDNLSMEVNDQAENPFEALVGEDRSSGSIHLSEEASPALDGAQPINDDDNDGQDLHSDSFRGMDASPTVTSEYLSRNVQDTNREHLVTVPVPHEKEMAPSLHDPWKCDIEDQPDRLLRRRKNFKLPCDITSLKQERKRKHDGKSPEAVVIMARIMVSDIISCGMGKRDYFNYMQDFHVEFLHEVKLRQKQEREKRRKERKELHNRISSEYNDDFRGFEDYEASSGEEEGFLGYPDAVPELDSPEDCPDEFPMPPPCARIPPHPVQSSVEENDSYQSVLQQKLKEFEVYGTQCVQSNLVMRVNNWHNSIRPVLEAAQQRGHFDIHQYGTKILESFPKGTAKTTIPFADVVRGESKEDVSRFFLASLMLANTYNVKISKSDPSELAMDCMELTLLTSVRHHETLDEYQAPSQERRSIASTSASPSKKRQPLHHRKRGK